MNILVALEGVLSDEHGKPIKTGIELYRSLKPLHKIVLVSNQPQKAAEHWLTLNGLTDFDGLICEVPSSELPLRLRQIELARARGGNNFLIIDQDPSVILWCFERGLTGLLFLPNDYIAPKNRPDIPGAKRKWDEISSEIEKQKLIRADRLAKGDNELLNWE